MSIAAIIMAAGASSRLGRPKQTLLVQGETLLARAVRSAFAAGLAPVITVVADPGLLDDLHALGATPLLNPSAHKGIASSIRIGVRCARQLSSTGAVLMTCDQPGLTPGHLRDLCAHPSAPAGSTYAGKVGVPAFFPAANFDQLLALTGDRGASPLLRGVRSVHNEALSFDIDTQADLDRLRAEIC